MNTRTERLREESLRAVESLSAERARLLTAFYREHEGRHPAPVMRALAYDHLCRHKTLHLGRGELIVGERGPAPKAVPTFPELICHGPEDLAALDSRPLTSYAVTDVERRIHEDEIIPYWRGRSLREKVFAALPDEWHEAYSAGIFTEFMEQRAPGHTVADDKIYRLGLRGLVARIAEAETALADPDDRQGDGAEARRAQLSAMRIAAEATILFARRHAALALELAAGEQDADRRAELEHIAAVCERVPTEPPRDFHEALQAYWFCHLGVITELNGWDAYSPGHLDQHLEPFYRRGLADGTLTRESARELLECFFIKFNNHPAPPKVGVTAAESGTYGDFANINLAGLRPDGTDGVGEVSYLLLEVIADLHLIQPGNNVQISAETPEPFLRQACKVIRRGHGFPSVFNADQVVAEMLRQGKTLDDARAAGTSGCVEAGVFGREAYILTGYFNLPKLLELALNRGLDPRTGTQLGPCTGDPAQWRGMEDVLAAWRVQLDHFIAIKLEGNRIIEEHFARHMPAPFLSLLTDDCIERGLDYNAGGARYNTSYIQGVGIGTLTDSLAALRRHVFTDGTVGLDELSAALADDFAGHEILRRRLLHRTPRWGTDDDEADDLMREVFDAFFDAVDGRPNGRGGTCHIDMLPTTCHVYFGTVLGATSDGRTAGAPLSEGISPTQGMDRQGPTAVLLSAAKMDHVRTGGTLLNLKFTPDVLAGESGLDTLASLIRTYFRLGGHHLQFNVVDAETLRQARRDPAGHEDLIVRVAGYSDYFCDLIPALQEEIIARTAHGAAGGRDIRTDS